MKYPLIQLTLRNRTWIVRGAHSNGTWKGYAIDFKEGRKFKTIEKFKTLDDAKKYIIELILFFDTQL